MPRKMNMQKIKQNRLPKNKMEPRLKRKRFPKLTKIKKFSLFSWFKITRATSASYWINRSTPLIHKKAKSSSWKNLNSLFSTSKKWKCPHRMKKRNLSYLKKIQNIWCQWCIYLCHVEKICDTSHYVSRNHNFGGNLFWLYDCERLIIMMILPKMICLIMI